MKISGLAFLASGIIVFLITPWVRRLAEYASVIDRPDRQRKLHRRLVSLWGGLAIFIGLLMGTWLALGWTASGKILVAYRHGLLGNGLPYLLGAGLTLLFLGLIDDMRPLPPKVKLLVQLLAAVLVVNAGFFTQPGYTIWTILGIGLSLIWLVFITNAFNFIDGLDGLATGISVITGSGLLLIAWIMNSKPWDLAIAYQYRLAAVLAAAVAGAALGFWRFNRWPAKIFLGEAGSSLLGFTLGLSALLLVGKAPSGGVIFAAALVLGWPILDTCLAVFRRLKRGEPISKADHRHLHHLLLEWGFTHTSAVAFIHAITLVLTLTGLVLAWLIP